MGQSSSGRRNPTTGRTGHETVPDDAPSELPGSQACTACRAGETTSVQHNACCGQPNKDAVMPFHKWLTMEAKLQHRHIQHARNCILSPFLFNRKNEYSEKVLVWLRQRDLLPKSRTFDCLSDKHIDVSHYAEEIADLILSGMTTKDFLYDVFQVTEQLKECNLLTEVFRMADDSELVQLVWQCSTFSSQLVKEDLLLVLMSVLNQAVFHVQMASDSTFDLLADFERKIRQEAQVCEGLRLRGNQYFQEKQFKHASVFYSKAINLRPFDPVLYGNRAQSYLNTTQYREALSDARRAVCLNPSWEKGYFRYAKAYYELGYYEKAIAVNSQALKSCSRTQELKNQAEQFAKGTATAAELFTFPISDESNTDGITALREKTKKAKLDQNESQSPASNTKRKRLDSSGQHQRTIPDEEDEFDNMPELLPSSSNQSPLQVTPACPPANNDDHDDNDDDGNEDDDNHDDDEQCDLESLPSLLSDASLSDCGDDTIDIDDDDDDDVDDIWDDSDVDLPELQSDLDDNVGDDDDDGDDIHEDTESSDDDELPFMGPFGGMPNPTELFIGGAMVLDLIRQFLEAHPEMESDDTPPGALPEVIESLTKSKITKTETDSGSSCCICQCDFELDEEAACLPCKHTFHVACVSTWLKMHATCPTCRDVLPH